MLIRLNKAKTRKNYFDFQENSNIPALHSLLLFVHSGLQQLQKESAQSKFGGSHPPPHLGQYHGDIFYRF